MPLELMFRRSLIGTVDVLFIVGHKIHAGISIPHHNHHCPWNALFPALLLHKILLFTYFMNPCIYEINSLVFGGIIPYVKLT
jgi:hypothetical protein